MYIFYDGRQEEEAIKIVLNVMHEFFLRATQHKKIQEAILLPHTIKKLA